MLCLLQVFIVASVVILTSASTIVITVKLTAFSAYYFHIITVFRFSNCWVSASYHIIFPVRLIAVTVKHYGSHWAKLPLFTIWFSKESSSDFFVLLKIWLNKRLKAVNCGDLYTGPLIKKQDRFPNGESRNSEIPFWEEQRTRHRTSLQNISQAICKESVWARPAKQRTNPTRCQ